MQSSPETVDSQYAWGLRANAIAMLLVTIWFIGRRYQAARIERAAERALDEQALAR